MTTPPTRASARPLHTLAAVALLLVALALAPRPDTAQAAPHTDQPIAAAVTDSLWAAGTATGGVNTSFVAACASPNSAEASASCFAGGPGTTWNMGKGGPFVVNAMATDGRRVFLAGEGDNALSCPVSGLGGKCTVISGGPMSGSQILSLAAGNGRVWLGRKDGKIYRCPSNISDLNQPTRLCTQLDDAGKRAVTSLVFANGRLYAGLANYGSESKKQGLLWSCDPDTANSCTTLDSYGATTANSLVAGGGYLWAGLDNGIIWQCDPQQANACINWREDYFVNGGISYSRITSLSYGQDFLYIASEQKVGRTNYPQVWSCGLDRKDNCDDLGTTWVYVDHVGYVGRPVAAGPSDAAAWTNAFWSAGDKEGSSMTQYGENLGFYANASSALTPTTQLVYVPADGPVGVGGVSVKVAGIYRLRAACTTDNGARARLRLAATGRHGLVARRTVNLCRAHRTGTKTTTVTVNRLLDPGRYIITARGAGLRTRTAVTVTKNHTTRVRLRLSPGRG